MITLGLLFISLAAVGTVMLPDDKLDDPVSGWIVAAAFAIVSLFLTGCLLAIGGSIVALTGAG